MRVLSSSGVWPKRMLIAVAWLVAAISAAPAFAQTRQQFIDARNRMVDEEIVGAGVTNPRVIEAMRNTPRHEFVAVSERKNAYYDMALPIGEGQTISPPFVVAFMTEEIDPQPSDKVLEIGTGSGFQAAVLSPLVKDVYSIEIVKPLGERAAKTLKRLKYANVHTKIGDGYKGWPEHAPFDKVIVTCSPENVPQDLVDQLKEGGRMVIPLGERYQQTMYLFKKIDGELVSEALRPTLFVPMTGAAEDKRQVKPDPLKPSIYNGGFEEISQEGAEEGQPIGWHYVRQLTLIESEEAPEGKHFALFRNAEPGRGSQALQAFAIDGRQIAELDVRFRVKGKDIRKGQEPKDLPMLSFTFYDERRAIIGHPGIGPWRGTFDWQTEHEKIKVPIKAREVIIGLGLLGAVGEISFDDLKLEAVPDKKAEKRSAGSP